jgi:hypothetical protein
MATTDNNPQEVDTFAVEQDTSYAAGGKVRVSIAGAPGDGAAVCIVYYSTPNA